MRTYSILKGKIAPYGFYRLNITANNDDSDLQLALFSPPIDAKGGGSLLVTDTPSSSERKAFYRFKISP